MHLTPTESAHSTHRFGAIRAVLFDHDGTLVDSEPLHFKLWLQVLAPFGVDLTEAVFNTYYAGLPTLTNAKDIINRFRVNESAQTLVELKNQATRHYLSESPYPLLPGVENTVTRLHELGFKVGVVTGANRYSVGSTLKHYRFATLFSVVVCADDVSRSKPDPDCYVLASQKIGIPPPHCLAIEDTAHGMHAALGAGMRCLVVPTALSKHHDFSGAEKVLDTMDQAFEYIQHINQVRI